MSFLIRAIIIFCLKILCTFTIFYHNVFLIKLLPILRGIGKIIKIKKILNASIYK
ncbi:MAG: hypothetical protein RLZZ546_1419 [Bacteroidota bacterium]